ncbi:anti-sigma factor family protein [Streptomyces sp. NPDC003042]
MSPTTGTTRHPEVSEISDLTEGLLSPSRTAEVRRHLGDCALCADVRTSLQEIRSLLGTLPGPPRMPSAIAGRIDAALAAEALLDATSSRSTPAPARTDSTDGTDRDVSRETSPAAVGRREDRRPTGHPSGSTGPGRRRARRRIALLAGLAGAAACALGVFLVSGLTGTASHDTATHGDAASASSRSVEGEYTAQGLQDKVRQLLAVGTAGTDMRSAPAETDKTMGLENASPGLAPSDRQAPPESSPVPPCVRQSIGRADIPLAAELGTYQGTAAYLVVLPHAGDSARVDAYLVSASCADAPSRTPEKPLLTSTYPRP